MSVVTGHLRNRLTGLRRVSLGVTHPLVPCALGSINFGVPIRCCLRLGPLLDKGSLFVLELGVQLSLLSLNLLEVLILRALLALELIQLHH